MGTNFSTCFVNAISQILTSTGKTTPEKLNKQIGHFTTETLVSMATDPITYITGIGVVKNILGRLKNTKQIKDAATRLIALQKSGRQLLQRRGVTVPDIPILSVDDIAKQLAKPKPPLTPIQKQLTKKVLTEQPVLLKETEFTTDLILKRTPDQAKKMRQIVESNISREQKAQQFLDIKDDIVVNEIKKVDDLGFLTREATDVERIPELMQGKTEGLIKKAIYEPVLDAQINVNKRIVDVSNKNRNAFNALRKNVKGSKKTVENRLRLFVEGDVAAVPQSEATAYAEANNAYRQIYDNLFVQQNKVLRAAGQTPINYRTDYVRHFKEISALQKEFGSLDNVPEAIYQEWQRTGKFSFGAHKTRLDKLVDNELTGAFNALEEYATGSSKTIEFTPIIQKYRKFAKALAESKPGTSKFFNRLADDMAGIPANDFEASSLARGAQKIVSRSVANVIAGKASVILNQVAAYPNILFQLTRKVGPLGAFNQATKELGKEMGRSLINIPTKNAFGFVKNTINRVLGNEILLLQSQPLAGGLADKYSKGIRLLQTDNLAKRSGFVNTVLGAGLEHTDMILRKAGFNAGFKAWAAKNGHTLKEVTANSKLLAKAIEAGDFILTHSQAHMTKILKPQFLRTKLGSITAPIQTFTFNNFNTLRVDMPVLMKEAQAAGLNPWVAGGKAIGSLIGGSWVTNQAFKSLGLRAPIEIWDYLPFVGAARFEGTSTLKGLFKRVTETTQVLVGEDERPSTDKQIAEATVRLLKDAAFGFALPGGGRQLESLLFRGEIISTPRRKGEKAKQTQLARQVEFFARKHVGRPLSIAQRQREKIMRRLKF